MRLPVRVLLALAFGFSAAHAQTSDAHEREVHRESERNTQYHNNADDYNFKSGPATPAAGTGNYHDYRKDGPATSTYIPSTTQFKDFWFGKIIVPPDSYSIAEGFQLHVARARQGDPAERMYVAQISYTGTSYKTSDGQTRVVFYKNLPLAYHYYSATADNFPYAEYRMGAMQYYGQGANADCASGLKHMQNAAARGEAVAATALATMQLPLTGPLPASPKDCAATLTSSPTKPLREQYANEIDYFIATASSGTPAAPARMRLVTCEIVFDPTVGYVWDEGWPEVYRIADKLKATTGRYEIASYTEGDEGSPALSIKRADWLRKVLVGHGIAADRLVAKGYGDTKQFPGRNDRIEIRPLD